MRPDSDRNRGAAQWPRAHTTPTSRSSAPAPPGCSPPTTPGSAASASPSSTRCPSWAARSPRCIPEKQILDVAGFPTIKGRDLVDGLVEQANTAEPEYLLDRTATGLDHGDDDVTVTLDDGTEVPAKALS